MSNLSYHKLSLDLTMLVFDNSYINDKAHKCELELYLGRGDGHFVMLCTYETLNPLKLLLYTVVYLASEWQMPWLILQLYLDRKFQFLSYASGFWSSWCDGHSTFQIIIRIC